ncbi:3-oxoacyl-[acyl-carrier-protein] reductase [Chloroflexota bacterium]
MTSKELDGRVSLITGASRGIGRAVALKLASLGSKLAINHIEPEKANADAVVEAIAGQGGEAMAVEADIRDAEAVKTMIDAVIERWGKIDILVNNAGITRDNLLLRMSDEAWDDVININLRGAYLCTKLALRPMVKQRWGRVISMSSISGIIGTAGQGNYSASKGGLIGFTKSISREVGSANITVNAIAPGFIMTDMTDRLSQERKDEILSMISLRRFGQPEDVAELIAFLASDRSSYITGQVIGLDGGM